jgi:phosphohistidine phosphatase
MDSSRTLILMRHAEAGGATRDHDRPLSARGVQDATAAGDWIRNHQPRVDAVLCSTAVRTRQTLTATRIDCPATFADELYGGNVDDILEQIAQLPDSARTVLVVGHAPGIPSTAFELCTIADLAADASPGTDAGSGEPVQRVEAQALRGFSACALAVLSTGSSWDQLADRGADLVTVRHPDR